MTTIDSAARPLDPRQEGVQQRLTRYTPDEHLDLVRTLGCDHEAVSLAAGTTWYHWCDGCRAQRELDLAEA